MTKITYIFAFFICTLNAMGATSNDNILSLMGEWHFAIDSLDVGISEHWQNKKLHDKIILPGSLQQRGYGNDINTDTPWVGQIVDSSWWREPIYAPYREKGNIKIPFALTPNKHYVGVAWYQKSVKIPENWVDKTILLNLERPHWETTIFVDGRKIDSVQNTLAAPHIYELGRLSAGKHCVSIRVDSRMIVDVGCNSHAITDHTQTDWNGIVGEMFLESKTLVFQSDVQIYPSAADKNARVVMTIENRTGGPSSSKVYINATSKDSHVHSVAFEKAIDLPVGTSVHEFTIDLGGDIQLWDEFTPNLYVLTSVVESAGSRDKKLSSFGVRDIGVSSRRFTINGKPIFLRGTLDCAIFPLTGYPAMQKPEWTKIFNTVKEYGLNHVRFHSWCPPKAAFDVADSLGLYLQIECSAWALTGAGTNYDTWVYSEADRIIKEYGNHPSFFALLAGNEPGGENSAAVLQPLVGHWKSKNDSRRMYSSASGWPYVENADFYSTADPRIQPWGAGLNSKINAEAPATDWDYREIIRAVQMPTVSHEIGQWCAYPNFKEIEKYTGFLKAKNFEIFRDFLEQKSMADLSDKFLLASGKLQTLCYKSEIEASLRTPEFAGFQQLGLQDFPGHGTALVGVLDAFWESKGYVSSDEYRMFCNSTVPLARMKKLTWRSDEIFKADIEVAHFGNCVINNASISWKITNTDGELIKSGLFRKYMPLDNCIEVGSIELPLNNFTRAVELQLQVGVDSLNVINSWNFWVYPSQLNRVKDEICITQTLDSVAQHVLNNGGSVLLTLKNGSVRNDKGGDIAVGFSPIFWNSSYTSGQPPHLLGILCDPKHSSLSEFPTSFHSDYQWWEVLKDSQAIVLDDLPSNLRPIVYLIDDWYTNRKLGLVFEVTVGKGKMLITGVDLIKDLDKRIVVKQLKYSLVEYMKSDRFKPHEMVNIDNIKELLK